MLSLGAESTLEAVEDLDRKVTIQDLKDELRDNRVDINKMDEVVDNLVSRGLLETTEDGKSGLSERR